jgi:hypothetical protein
VLAADDGQGLYKLQLIKEAKRACPDVVIVLGEDLTRFRNASKDLYAFLNAFSWNQKVERLGFDEVGLSVIITFFLSRAVTATAILFSRDTLFSFLSSSLCRMRMLKREWLGLHGCVRHCRLQCRPAESQ